MSLTVNLISPDGVKLPNTEITSDMTVQDIIREMVDHLTLPYMLDGEPVTYSLKWENQNLQLKGQQTLSQAGVSNGDNLRLLSSKQVPTSAPTGGGAASASNGAGANPLPGKQGVYDGPTIEVVLSVLDLNSHQNETLPLDMPIQHLIQSFSKKYHLPDRDELNAQTSYYMKSKALGRVLNGSETLRQAGVPRGDRLAVLRQEIAG